MNRRSKLLIRAVAMTAVFVMAYAADTSLARAEDPVAKKPTTETKSAAPAARPETKGPPVDDLTKGGRRGQIEDQIEGQIGEGSSMCEVAPPCPAGCKEDTASHMCVEKAGP